MLASMDPMEFVRFQSFNLTDNTMVTDKFEEADILDFDFDFDETDFPVASMLGDVSSGMF